MASDSSQRDCALRGNAPRHAIVDSATLPTAVLPVNITVDRAFKRGVQMEARLTTWEGGELG